MKTGVVIATLAGILATAPSAAAQTLTHLNIDIEGNVVSLTGGERGSVRMPTSGVEIGKTTRTTISRRENGCGLAVGPSPQPQAIAVWTVEVTPLQVYASAVTFQLKWSRAAGSAREASSVSGDARVTLQPGQSLPVDSLPISDQGKVPASICDLKAMTFRVAVGFWPRAEDDTRLMNTELWLVEKLADGSERSQALTLKAGINQSTPFYFEPVTVAGSTVQLFGAFTLTPVGNTYTLTLNTQYRPASGLQSIGPGTSAQQNDVLQRQLAALRARGYSNTHPDVLRLLDAIDKTRNQAEADNLRRFAMLQLLFGPRSLARVESAVSLTPGEVVDVQLPQIARSNTVGGQTFSIRIRARQIQ